MPYTLNGIGTHYYGAGNRSARVDVCQSCRRSATLSSYDTREWVCVLFIPIIPLRRYRILNDCSRCRRHQRIARDEFGQKLAQATAPLRQAISRTPRDPQPHIDLIRTLIGWEMRADAEHELEAATALFPQSVTLMLLAAELAIGRADLKGALPLYERAYALEPQNAAVTYGYGWTLHRLEQHERAVPILLQALSQEGNRAGVLYLLGTSQMKLSRWNEALNSYQQLLALDPTYQQDKNLLRQIRECKQRLGYQLTDAERRASRRWWPFSRTAKSATLQPQPTLVRPSLRIAGLVIVGIMLLGGGFYLWDKWTNIHIYFDNGLDRAVRIDLDRGHFDLARNTMRDQEVRSGGHSVLVRTTDGKELERLTFDLRKLSLFDAMMHERFFVYNVAARKVYRRAVHGYAARREDASYSEELIGMQRFFEQRDVDYPFQDAPRSISVDSGTSGVVRKVSFSAAKDVDLKTYALIRLQQGKMDEARKAIDAAAVQAPCDTQTRRAQVFVAGLAGSFETAARTAHQWMSDCAPDDLEAHRAYEDVATENGRQEALRDEYRKLLDGSPSSGKAHYLYGRVLGDPALAAAEYQEAVRLDPRLIWAHVALGHAYGMMERYDDALREFGAALDMPQHDPSVVVYYATTAIAKGTPADVVTKVEELRKANPRDPAVLESRWLLALAAADWTGAAEIQKQARAQETLQAAWWHEAKLLRMKGDPALEGRIAEAIASRELHSLGVQMRIQRLIESGDFAHSAETIARNGNDLEPSAAAMLQAYTAAGFLLQGNAAEGEKLLTEAEKAVDAAPKGSAQRLTRAVVEGLRGTISLDAVMAAARETNVTAHAWFVSGVRAALAGDRAREAEEFAHCVRAASDLEFPYLEVKAMAAAVIPRTQ